MRKPIDEAALAELHRKFERSFSNEGIYNPYGILQRGLPLTAEDFDSIVDDFIKFNDIQFVINHPNRIGSMVYLKGGSTVFFLTELKDEMLTFFESEYGYTPPNALRQFWIEEKSTFERQL